MRKRVSSQSSSTIWNDISGSSYVHMDRPVALLPRRTELPGATCEEALLHACVQFQPLQQAGS
eukprot:6194636-Pleurochrysis_carterae.AAC.2